MLNQLKPDTPYHNKIKKPKNQIPKHPKNQKPPSAQKDSYDIFYQNLLKQIEKKEQTKNRLPSGKQIPKNKNHDTQFAIPPNYKHNNPANNNVNNNNIDNRVNLKNRYSVLPKNNNINNNNFHYQYFKDFHFDLMNQRNKNDDTTYKRSKSINREINKDVNRDINKCINNYIRNNKKINNNNNNIKNSKLKNNKPPLFKMDLVKKENHNRLHTPILVHNNQQNYNYIQQNAPKYNINNNNKRKKPPNINVNIENTDRNNPQIKLRNLNYNVYKDVINNLPRPSYTPQNKNSNNIVFSSKNNIVNKNENTNKVSKDKCFLSYAYMSDDNREYRDSMEDYYCINPNLIKENNSYSLFGIFDGHSGIEVASFLSLNFPKFLYNELSKIKLCQNHNENNKNYISCIKKTFELIDENIKNNKNIKDDVGSTGTIIFFYKEKNLSKKILICANVGDSKGFLIKKNTIIQITKDHDCKDKTEVERIKKEGGVVFQGRVFGTLILTRSFGDKEMKKYGLISIPDIFNTQINEDDLYVVIASDGVWDVVNKEDIFEMAKKNLSSEEFSKIIIKTAKDNGTRDNVSCIVIKLNNNNNDFVNNK